ncbi:hemolysin family protein [Alteribacter keqinensis]|uniref:HlyC/CorC family transporter n=1 Tax=Alteribacter keqinensis TaxID=2483800 RepID=A0A3M7TXM7_9BACI|nr:hemolysin family protein [Alteribacter keqinensis]RNA70041.1 HlyC/CorC family transporter [Alteribacter keqinensis]
MGDVPLLLILFLVLLLLLSAFFSSAETAFSSANRIRLKTMKDDGNKGAGKALYITEHFDQALSTILVGNNLVNIAAATISAQLAVQIFGPSLGVFISTFVVTILVLIFGEILPKSFAKEYAEAFSSKISGVLLLLIRVIYPVNWLFLQLKKGVSSLIEKNDTHPSVTEEELKMMVEISEEEGVIDENERELVHRSFDFNDIIVAEVFKPRTNMTALNVTEDIEVIKETFFRERFSRIPIYEGNIDNIIGVLSERDFFTSYIRGEVDIRALVREPIFVVESMKIHALLPQLQKEKIHMAIVIDEYGGTSGLITLEDILEELVGEIYDEHDDDVKLFKQMDASTYLFHADYPLDDFARFTGVELPDTIYHTLGGWLSEEFQRIPDKGDELTYENLNLKVHESDERRVRTIMVTSELLPNASASG